MSDIGEPIRKSDGLEKGEERFGSSTPLAGKPGGGYKEADNPEAESDLDDDLGGDEPGEDGGDIGLAGDPDPGGDLDPM